MLVPFFEGAHGCCAHAISGSDFPKLFGIPLREGLSDGESSGRRGELEDREYAFTVTDEGG